MTLSPILPDEMPNGPRGNYRKTAVTRARILDAALEVFGAQGYDAGSLREVAALAGISQAGLLHHFPNKVALLSAVIERRDEGANELSIGRSTGIEVLGSLVEYARESAFKPGEIELFAVLSAEATRPEHPANSYMRRRYEWVTEIAVESLTVARDAGHLRPGVDPVKVASQMFALWDGLQIQWLLKVNDVNVADGVEHFLDLHLVKPLRELLDETRTRGDGNPAPPRRSTTLAPAPTT
ncbi:TetR/AcrR family transcriptional regulator [Tessaracoccus sp. G1721]